MTCVSCNAAKDGADTAVGCDVGIDKRSKIYDEFNIQNSVGLSNLS